MVKLKYTLPSGEIKREKFKSDVIGLMVLDDIRKEYGEVKATMSEMFDSYREDVAKRKAEKMNGTCRVQVIPDYMSCDYVWIVEWEV